MPKITGPVTYQAKCGDLFIDTRDYPKRNRFGRMVMGWKGDKRTKNMKEDSLPPERCIGCRNLRKDSLTLFDEEMKEFFNHPVWSCYTYRAVDSVKGTPSIVQ